MEEQILAFVELMGGRGNEELLRPLAAVRGYEYGNSSFLEALKYFFMRMSIGIIFSAGNQRKGRSRRIQEFFCSGGIRAMMGRFQDITAF